MLTAITAALNVVGQTLGLIAEKQRTRYINEYHDIKKMVAKHENETYPHYSDAVVDLLNERMCIFMESVGRELEKEGMARL